jgi:hypothetical protein
MSGKRQKIRYSLALGPKGRGEALVSGHPRAEPLAAKPAPQSPAGRNTSWKRCAIERISKERGNAFGGTRAVPALMG